MVEKKIMNSIKQQARVAEEIEIELAPIRLRDLLKGRVRDLSFSAVRIGFPEGPVFEDFNLKSEKICVEPGTLLLKGKVEIQELAQTFLSFKIPESELTLMMRRDLPDLEPTVFLEEGEVELEGSLNLLGQGRLPFKATATVEKASDQSLRLSPSGLKVGGIPLFAGIFEQYSQRLAWEFPLELPWPVRLTNFKIEPGYIRVEWQDEQEREG